MRVFGLIGKVLGHSFSKKYFTRKFLDENIEGSKYELFPLSEIDQLPRLLEDNPNIQGLNVTIPYKESVSTYLTERDESSRRVGATNVILVQGKDRIGYNSDYFGFKSSLENWLSSEVESALVLGTGGSSKAVTAALEDLGIQYHLVTRAPKPGMLTYQDVNSDPSLLDKSKLIVNTTPVGMYPNDQALVDLPYQQMGPKHYCFDLVYNPEQTRFMREAQSHGAKVKNGLEMLYLQAEKSWEIWNSHPPNRKG